MIEVHHCVANMHGCSSMVRWREGGNLVWDWVLRLPGMGPDLGETMGRSSKSDELKNPRRVMAGKMVYMQKKSAQDAADREELEKIVAGVVLVGFLVVAALVFFRYG
ncbi:hypothetical protein QC590_12620 [Pseudomonas putida]|uniref:hypothetical protein n=1 Tax=Pseudomonas putida TaxID=303 RepID=UPI00335406BA